MKYCKWLFWSGINKVSTGCTKTLTVDLEVVRKYFKFCPICGARIKKEKEKNV